MHYRLWLPVIIFLAVSASAQAIDVRISVTEVSDRRSTGQFFNNLEIKLRLTGDDTADIKGIRAVVAAAVDDSGRNLLAADEKSSGFEPVRESGSGQPEVTLALKNPARRATALKEISGELQLFMPARDPAATVFIKNIAKTAGKPVSDPALEKAGIGLTVLTKKEYDLIRKEEEKKAKNAVEKQGLDQAMMKAFEGLFGAFFQVSEHDLVLKVSDPANSLIEIEVVDAKGSVMRGQGSMKSGDLRVMNYSDALPADAQIRIFLKTPKSVVSVPLKLVEIALP